MRFAGIDAPESKQAFGQASKKHLSDLVYDRDVTLDCSKKDKYKRNICVIKLDGMAFSGAVESSVHEIGNVATIR